MLSVLDDQGKCCTVQVISTAYTDMSVRDTACGLIGLVDSIEVVCEGCFHRNTRALADADAIWDIICSWT